MKGKREGAISPLIAVLLQMSGEYRHLLLATVCWVYPPALFHDTDSEEEK